MGNLDIRYRYSSLFLCQVVFCSLDQTNRTSCCHRKLAGSEIDQIDQSAPLAAGRKLIPATETASRPLRGKVKTRDVEEHGSGPRFKDCPTPALDPDHRANT
jgi:hypothetical protein